ncbi:MAG: 4Fe-4S binding protein [Ignavibacteriales bacterium]|nr:4Fe-4S binding protein [Ignavibacteriales bacterium]
MINRIRIYFQSAVLILILYVAIRPTIDKSYIDDFEQYCPFGGIAAFFSKLNQDTMSCSMSEVQVLLGLGLLFGVGFIGKLFCSYICPIGSTSEWLSKLTDRVRFRVPDIADRILRGLKYLLLFITVYLTMTSGELLCKKFDPYFSAVNLFSNNDIVLYYAIPALILTIAGAIFLRVAWCKYLCPLGAVSNIFMNIGLLIGVIALYFAANIFGAQLSILWLLSGLVIAGWLNESLLMKSVLLPIPKITRDVNACTDCGNCDENCPQGIKISSMPVVNHIDCHLCTDCVYACPKKQVLSINKKKSFKYLAPVSVIVLIAISLGMTNYFEFTTVSLRWGTQTDGTQMYEQSGIKTIKCYGSSMSLAGTLEQVEGIIGLDTYAKSNKVKIYYNPGLITEENVKAALFTSGKYELRTIVNNYDSIGVLDIGIYRLFDAVDFNNLNILLKQKEGIVGFESYFGEPVRVTVYYYAQLIDPEEIKMQIEKKSILYKTETGENELELDFDAEEKYEVRNKIIPDEYLKRIFIEFDDDYSDGSEYNEDELKIFKFPLTGFENSQFKNSLEYLSGYLSNIDGIIRFAVRYNKGVFGYIYYDENNINADKIISALQTDKISYYISETEKEEIDNPFKFNGEGKSYNVSELNRLEARGQ